MNTPAPSSRDSIPSNTSGCFQTFVGERLIGVVEDLIESHEPDISCRTLIFESGRGLTITSNGTYWLESRNTVRAAADARLAFLAEAKAKTESAMGALNSLVK